jgi:SWI/SNF-related matrix-associated actin-dependent regulator 1 of chromatin subfamily A
LVIVPSSVRFQWGQQFEKWIPNIGAEDINIMLSGKSASDKLINIVSYDLVAKMEDQIANRRFKVIIADESHLLKSYSAKRTKVIQPLLKVTQNLVIAKQLDTRIVQGQYCYPEHLP